MMLMVITDLGGPVRVSFRLGACQEDCRFDVGSLGKHVDDFNRFDGVIGQSCQVARECGRIARDVDQSLDVHF